MYQIKKYFQPLQTELLKTCCTDSTDGPIETVLRKSYQSNWK